MEEAIKQLKQLIFKAENDRNVAFNRLSAASLEHDKVNERYYALCDALALLEK